MAGVKSVIEFETTVFDKSSDWMFNFTTNSSKLSYDDWCCTPKYLRSYSSEELKLNITLIKYLIYAGLYLHSV